MKVTTNDGTTFELKAETPTDFDLIGALDHQHSVYITSIGRNANNTSATALLEVNCRGEKASAARDARQALQSLRDLFSLGLGHSADHRHVGGRPTDRQPKEQTSARLIELQTMLQALHAEIVQYKTYVQKVIRTHEAPLEAKSDIVANDHGTNNAAIDVTSLQDGRTALPGGAA